MPKEAALALFLIAAYATSAWFSLEHLRGPDGRAALYFSNGFLLSGLLLLRGPTRWFCLAGSVLACAAVVALRGGNPVYALGAGVIAGISCMTGYLLGRRVLKQPRLRTFHQAILLLTMVIVPSSLMSGVLSSLWLGQFGRVDLASSAVQWFFASLVGVSMVLPTLLILANRSERPASRNHIEVAFLTLFVVGLLAAPYFGGYYLSLVLAFPAANVLALRLGSKPTALLLTGINLNAIALPLMYEGSVLNAAEPGVARYIVLGLQIYAIIVFYNGVLTALAIDQQARTKRHLEHQTAVARRARTQALEASRAKTDFLATMSHEIRTPLNAILGFSQILERREDLPKDAVRQIGMIQRSGESLLTVVNDILDFSKVEAGMLTLDPRPAELAAVAEETLAIVTPAAQDKGLATGLRIEGDLAGRHLVDDNRVRQVLLNFLNNAVKFTEAGRIDLVVSIKPLDDGRDRIRLTVTDTGIGISKDALPRLFQRFSQADSSISRSYGGTGLGLSISKGLVDLMGGRVGVGSVEGEGSTFWFELSLDRVEAAVGADQDEDAAGLDAAHILLVDDNAANRELGAAVLAMLGCTTEIACDGREAVAAASLRRFDAILMDVHMPGMDGLAATRAIRALDGGSAATPIIAMTADVLPEQIERCRAAGMVDHIAKPINVALLTERLARWLGETVPPGRSEAA